MPSRSHDDLTVAVIHFETPKLLESCLQAVRAAAPKARLLVVDTGESSPLPLDWEHDHPNIELMRQPNHSFAAAVNAALALCQTPRFAHLNADAIVEPHTFDELATAIDATGAAMAGPLARDGSGEPQRNGIPYRWNQWQARRLGVSHAPWVSGCLQYLRMEAVRRVGGMDASLRFYNEDLEWCLRLRASGEKCVLVDSEIVHLGGSSTSKATGPLVEGLRGGYQVTRRYQGPAVRFVHRWGVFLVVGLLALVEPDSQRRRAYRRIARMFRRNEFEESPFGATLGSESGRPTGRTFPAGDLGDLTRSKASPELPSRKPSVPGDPSDLTLSTSKPEPSSPKPSVPGDPSDLTLSTSKPVPSSRKPSTAGDPGDLEPRFDEQ